MINYQVWLVFISFLRITLKVLEYRETVGAEVSYDSFYAVASVWSIQRAAGGASFLRKHV